MIDRKGRRIRQGTVHEEAECVACRSDDGERRIMSVRQGYRHHDKTGHTVRIQRIKIKEISRPAP